MRRQTNLTRWLMRVSTCSQAATSRLTKESLSLTLPAEEVAWKYAETLVSMNGMKVAGSSQDAR